MIKLRLIFICLTLAINLFGPIFALKFAKYPYENKYYPLWSYKLFADFPRESESYSVRVSKLDAQVFDPAVDLFTQLPTREGLFSPSVIIELIGKSFEHGDLRKFNEAKETLEKFKFQDFKTVNYSIFKIRWNALARYQFGKNIKETHLVDCIYTSSKN